MKTLVLVPVMFFVPSILGQYFWGAAFLLLPLLFALTEVRRD